MTSCVSCHTVAPYALARPALRKAAGVGAPAPQEERLLRETLLRVATYGSHEPLYKSKADESRGSEAVLNLLVLVGELAPDNHAALAEPLRKAFEELWLAQRADGAWDWLDFGNEPYESADSLYYRAYSGEFDVVIAPYHDQGLIPVKLIAHGHSTNVTLGLPYVRTSPDHGTAFQIAGKNQADATGMKSAIHCALDLIARESQDR